jgi:2,3-diaminopropionate biosynthesis protein SbnA
MQKKISSIVNDNNYVSVTSLEIDYLFLKLESMNPSGSVKLKAALGMIAAAENQGLIGPGTMLIESSSGSLGVALAMVAAERGYHFTCVVDPNVSDQNLKMIRAFGANIVQVTERDENGGFLGTRIRYIEEKIRINPAVLWLNQYSNPENPSAHYRTTAPAISEAFPRLDYLFIGAGTTGTMMGCLNYFTKNRPKVKIVGVDSIGSVTFGHPPGKRFIPGLGTSRRPEIFNPTGLHAHEMVPEIDAVRMCRHLARTEGLLVGGSTGTVLAGVAMWRDRIPADSVVVAISPDLGDRYLDTIYNDDWVNQKFGRGCLSSVDFLPETSQEVHSPSPLTI